LLALSALGPVDAIPNGLGDLVAVPVILLAYSLGADADQRRSLPSLLLLLAGLQVANGVATFNPVFHPDSPRFVPYRPDGVSAHSKEKPMKSAAPDPGSSHRHGRVRIAAWRGRLRRRPRRFLKRQCLLNGSACSTAVLAQRQSSEGDAGDHA
jgi:hypothetical protein